ncbi:MAG: hypothetical protein ACTS6G_00535 [Candidatus Hodgkinia cicadicola]
MCPLVTRLLSIDVKKINTEKVLITNWNGLPIFVRTELTTNLIYPNGKVHHIKG